ncbi:hypothetical protein RRSWK_03846 [Rhodopirellula sp. SWK7]|nr:hypothetical protein RRSWK_03846 [Rhodopirellula sp. SWK7]
MCLLETHPFLDEHVQVASRNDVGFFGVLSMIDTKIVKGDVIRDGSA